VLGRLLELYQVPDARDNDSPLTQFVKDLIGLDQLDALINGLFNAGNIRRLRAPVPLYAEVRDEIQTIQGNARAQDAEIAQLRNEIAAAEAKLKETIAIIASDLAHEPLNLEALRSGLNRSAEEQRLSALAQIRRNLDAAHNEWRTLATSTAADRRQSLEQQATRTRGEVDRWRASRGQELERLIDQVASIFPDLPSSTGTDPEFARATALRSVEKEHARCDALLTQDDADAKCLLELDDELARAQGRSTVLDQQIAGLAASAGALAQALVSIAPHIHTDDCPVCGRDFAEISKRPLGAHLSARITSLTEDGGRLQALSHEKANLTAAIAQTTRQRSALQSRQISAATRNELQQRRAQLGEVRQKLEALASATRQGLAAINQASQAARALDALRSRDLQITNFRETLGRLAAALAIENVDLSQSVETTIAFFRSSLASEESRLLDLQQRKQRASTDLSIVLSLRVRLNQMLSDVANRQSRLAKLAEAKEEADARISAARELARKAREVRTSVVRHVFNDSLNVIWRDLFVRLAPEEPFIPAFALPDNIGGPVEAVLETIYRAGGKGGNPRAMLSAGNLNTAALTLFLSLHLSVQKELPWLVIDDPVQSMDEVHIAQFAALLRTLSKSHARQIILAVHERSLFDYLALELSPAFSDDRLTTVELGQAADGNTVCNFNLLTWSPDPAFAAA
jgi:exonuclease SbcC